ncbi:MAG: hypothetical protein IIC02_08390, partial [Planctomycetes bacterium]|nr:hypothetical protein [Planctomycetota bacterium]
MSDMFSSQQLLLEHAAFSRVSGRVCEVTGLTVVAEGLPLPVGALCRIDIGRGESLEAQVVGVRGHQAVLMTLREPLGVAVGDKVVSTAGLQHVPVGRQMLGTILDGLGRPIGGVTEFAVEAHYPVFRDAPPALSREPIVD